MTHVGRIKEIWRYPVKSMGGQMLNATSLFGSGIPKDRHWAVFDEQSGARMGGKPLPELLKCRATLKDSVQGLSVAHAEIELSDGHKICTTDPQLSDKLSRHLGRSIVLRSAKVPAEFDDRKAEGAEGAYVERLRSIAAGDSGVAADDLQSFPQELIERAMVPGSHFDLAPVHVLSVQTLDDHANINSEGDWDRCRFRPNFVLDLDRAAAPELEAGWLGRTIQIGGATILCMGRTQRCIMVSREQRDFPEAPKILRTITDESNRNLGIYAVVSQPGEVCVGDPVQLL